MTRSWIYEYDSLGQVKSGKRYWNDWTPVAGQQFEYAFDDIGNRTSTKTGGDAAGANLRTASYTNNSLNQITGRDVPSYLNIIGSATATNVNVNNTMAYRRGEYYRVELNPNNSSAAVWQSVTNRAVQNGTTNSVTGNVFLTKHAEAFSYDADGNLTNDGRWMLTWDAENRLTKAESQTGAPTGSKRKVEFTYDWHGILIRRIEYNGSSGSYVVTNDLKFLNDSLHCSAELNGTNNALVRSYLWGLDLSDTVNGAGGIGGLLALNSKAGGAHFTAYDGNGNVAGLVNAADGSVSANYDYSPFGERLRATGAMASENVYCFSTKRHDSATDWVHYEYRIYRPREGTWLNRDPIEERGGLNLYGFVKNSPVISFDRDGREPEGGYKVENYCNRKPYKPALENKACCCYKPAVIRANVKDDGSDKTQFRMRLTFTSKDGCYANLEIHWRTCYRTATDVGYKTDCDNSETCSFKPGSDCPSHVVGVYVDWLTCKNGKWVRDSLTFNLSCLCTPGLFKNSWKCD